MRNTDAGIKRIVQKRSRPGANAGQELEKAQKCLGFYVEPCLKLAEFNVPRRFAKNKHNLNFFLFVCLRAQAQLGNGVNNTLVWTPVCSSVGILTRPGPLSAAGSPLFFRSALQVVSAGNGGPSCFLLAKHLSKQRASLTCQRR